MVQCSVVCCPAADMSNSSQTTPLLFCSLYSWFFGSAAEGKRHSSSLLPLFMFAEGFAPVPFPSLTLVSFCPTRWLLSLSLSDCSLGYSSIFLAYFCNFGHHAALPVSFCTVGEACIIKTLLNHCHPCHLVVSSLSECISVHLRACVCIYLFFFPSASIALFSPKWAHITGIASTKWFYFFQNLQELPCFTCLKDRIKSSLLFCPVNICVFQDTTV